MPLHPGVRLGPYEALSAIGAGGMGEVWKARDTTLGRDVALKILPDHLALDSDRLARLKREAQILASLNHPNIAAIHGFQDSDGVQALVLELVEGPTLADRIAQGPMPVDEALPIAKQIAEALEAAHEQGIIHRDLKPANIKLRPDGTVKVLDFGLAKALSAEASTANLSMSPTITSPALMTAGGVILGTAAYMSPEQARGKVVDRRTDIWAFGCVLFEMLSGRRAFAGDDVSDILAFIITKEPDWSALPEQTPSAIRRLLRRALEKDRKERLPDIGVARIEIKEALTAPDAEVTRAVNAPGRSRERVVAWTLVVVLAVAAIALGIPYLTERPRTVSPPIRLSIAPPQGVALSAGSATSIAGGPSSTTSIPTVSPDGRRVAFVAVRAGVYLLWVRSLDALEAQPLPGTEGAAAPFWSPDSRALGFFADRALKIIDASGGSVRRLCDAPNARGGTWSPAGTIVFGSQSGGLSSVSAAGGSPAPFTTPDAAREETAHRFPSFLPDGQHILYWATPSNTILLGSLDSKESTRLLTAESQAVFVAPGSLLFVRQGTLVAQPFDARRATLTGEAVPITEQVLLDSSGAAAFGASSIGVLAYRADTLGASSHLTWVDRAGKPVGTVGSPGRYRNPELSPDGARVAVEAVDPLRGTQDIWLVELVRGLVSRFTFDPGNDVYPVWSPDGTEVMFASDRDGVFNLYQKRADGLGSEERVLQSSASMRPQSWAPDGRIVYTTDAYGPANLGILSLVGERTPRLFELQRFGWATGQVSPNGRWLAYATGESGRYEATVQSFPEPGAGKWQISTGGGNYTRWSRDGRELFYYALDGRLMAVPITNATAFQIDATVPLFEPHLVNGPVAVRGFKQQYDVARDGRFLLNLLVDDATPASITVVVNWTAALKE